ncbi:MAG: hypothetical protein EZS28_047753, partial [Streblomastix strix]
REKLQRMVGNKPMDVITIEYLMMQDPRKSFLNNKRLPLPGQRRPGLGCGHQVLHMIKDISERKHRDLLSSRPEFFHNSIFYDEFHYITPQAESWFRFLFWQLMPFISTRGLSVVSFALHLGCVYEQCQIPKRIAESPLSTTYLQPLYYPNQASEEFFAVATDINIMIITADIHRIRINI